MRLKTALLLSPLVALPLALAGPALGLGWTRYVAYVIPPALIAFLLLQTLRFALRPPTSRTLTVR